MTPARVRSTRVRRRGPGRSASLGSASRAPTAFDDARDRLSEWLVGGTPRRACRTCATDEDRADPRALLPSARRRSSWSRCRTADRPVALRRNRDARRRSSGRVAALRARARTITTCSRRSSTRLARACRDIVGRDVDSRACVDTAPLLEREAARRAGVGFTGKSTMTIAPGTRDVFLARRAAHRRRHRAERARDGRLRPLHGLSRRLSRRARSSAPTCSTRSAASRISPSRRRARSRASSARSIGSAGVRLRRLPGRLSVQRLRERRARPRRSSSRASGARDADLVELLLDSAPPRIDVSSGRARSGASASTSSSATQPWRSATRATRAP